MNSVVSYIFPTVLATAFHGLVIAALLTNWQAQPEIEVTPIEKYYIAATVVAENPHKAKERKADAAREEVRKRRVADEKRAADQRAKQEQDRKAMAERDALAKAKAEQAAKEQAQKQSVAATPVPPPKDSTRDVQEQERLRMEQSLALAIMDEQEYRRAITDDEKAMAFVGQIQREIVQNWSRPPSARNGMQMLLKVRLVPTGEVVDVAVLESSGNDAFDRSAVLAVQKARRFQVPTESRQFEKNFREFEVLFRPDDLRL